MKIQTALLFAAFAYATGIMTGRVVSPIFLCLCLIVLFNAILGIGAFILYRNRQTHNP